MSAMTNTAPSTVTVPIQDGYITMQSLRDFVEATDEPTEDERVQVLPDGLTLDVR